MLLAEGRFVQSKRQRWQHISVATSVQKVGLIILADGLFLKLKDTGGRHENLGLKTDIGLDKPYNSVATSFQKVGLIISAGGFFSEV